MMLEISLAELLYLVFIDWRKDAHEMDTQLYIKQLRAMMASFHPV